ELLEQVLKLTPIRLPGSSAPTPARQLIRNGIRCPPGTVRERVEIGAGADSAIDLGHGPGGGGGGARARRKGDDRQCQEKGEAASCRPHRSVPERRDGCSTTESTESVSTIVANSRWRSDRATAWTSSAGYRIPSGPIRSNVAVASETTQVSNPRFAAMRAVVETQWLVVNPTRTRVSWPAARSSASSEVPMKPLWTRFSMTRSPSRGAASALNAFPGWSGGRGELGSGDMCFRWS